MPQCLLGSRFNPRELSIYVVHLCSSQCQTSLVCDKCPGLAPGNRVLAELVDVGLWTCGLVNLDIMPCQQQVL